MLPATWPSDEQKPCQQFPEMSLIIKEITINSLKQFTHSREVSLNNYGTGCVGAETFNFVTAQ